MTTDGVQFSDGQTAWATDMVRRAVDTGPIPKAHSSQWLDLDGNDPRKMAAIILSEIDSRVAKLVAADAQPSARDRILTRLQLDDLPEPAPLIENTLDLRTFSLLVGHRATGKTFLALDWACCVATGKSWQGRTVKQGRVLYVAAEGAYGLVQRIAAWEQAWGERADGLDILPEPVQLLDDSAVADLASFAEPYRLVILDTLARCARGGDENSARDMGIVVYSAYRIRGDREMSVLLVHHTGKDKETTRGSSALEAGADTVYLTEGDARLLQLSRTKRKDGPPDDAHNLRLSPSADSVILQSHRGGQDHELTDAQTRLMSAYVSAFSETGASKAELRVAAGMPNASFHRALNGLLKQGALVNTGTDKRPHYVVATPTGGF